MSLRWSDLSAFLQSALLKVENRSMMITDAEREALIEKGLAVQKLGGVAITAEGRRVLNTRS
jgi:hypothetical protein